MIDLTKAEQIAIESLAVEMGKARQQVAKIDKTLQDVVREAVERAGEDFDGKTWKYDGGQLVADDKKEGESE